MIICYLILFSDSLSLLESLKHRKPDYPLIIKSICKFQNLSNNDDVLIYWDASHTEISRNDQTDKTARSTLNITAEKQSKIPHTNFEMNINK